ncbi:hypothetical protein AA313_de0206357 [Arthrobotrys entomopaga]|nr:hypothetical protein AA313_de0206357 [Arthrobotrys entomopaga]
MSMFANVIQPKTKLARYRLLSPTASVRVSPLMFGGLNLGTAWEDFIGTMDKKTGFELLDAFYNAGGNFIDTAINYQNGESEQWIGDWMEERKNRSEMVIATKFTTGYRYQDLDKGGVYVNAVGNSVKNLHESLRVSLKNLKTDYIDLLWVHWWDYTISVEELMQALNVFVKQGKVLYLGISDSPAWVVSKANEYARAHGLKGFSVYQGLWSAANREFERDIIHMCRVEGMGLCPWGSLGGGNFRLPEEREAMEKEGDKGRAWGAPNDKHRAVTLKLAKIAKERGLSITGVALAYVCSKAPNVIPVVGGRKVSHLMDNIKAIGVVLTEEEIKDIESAYTFEFGFPHDFLGPEPGPGKKNGGLDSMAWLDWPREGLPISIKDE